jgi:hypothetical protein
LLRRFRTVIWFKYSLILACVGTGLSVLRQAESASWPSQEFWSGWPGFVVVGAQLIAALLLSVQVSWLAWRLRSRRRLRNVQRAAQVLFVMVYKEATDRKLDASKLAVHVWKIKPSRLWRHDEELTRVARFRLLEHNKSNIRWTRDKGVLGRAWREDSPVTVDLRPLRKAARHESTFYGRSEEARFGLTFQEYRHAKHYFAIHARPLYDPRRRIMGMVSIDSMQGDAADFLEHAVEGEHIEQAVAAVESALQELLFVASPQGEDD